MTSKKEIYDLMPQAYYPKTLLIKPQETALSIKVKLLSANLKYPLIAKPDMGQRGVLVELITETPQLLEYLEKNPIDYLIQGFVDYPFEAGLFYYRYPDSACGEITGIVGKEYMEVVGDGRKTLKDLILENPRYRLQYKTLSKTYESRLNSILPQGEKLQLATYGNHCRGAKFVDLSHRITPQLTQSINAICTAIPGFYYGRLDVKFQSWEDLSEGRNFSIIELNGAASEPAHMYDSRHSIFFAWKEIIRHWQLLYEISKQNALQKHSTYMTHKEGFKMLRETYTYLNSISQ